MDKNNCTCILKTIFSLSLAKIYALSLLNLPPKYSISSFDVQ